MFHLYRLNARNLNGNLTGQVKVCKAHGIIKEKNFGTSEMSMKIHEETKRKRNKQRNISTMT